MRVLEKYYHQLKSMITPEVLGDIVPMEVSPAAKWFLGESPQEFWRYREDFPCVLPPAPVTWIEYEMPTIIRSAMNQVYRPARSVVALIMTLEIPEDQRQWFIQSDGLVGLFAHFRRKSGIRDGIEIMTNKRQERIQETLDKGLTARWVCVWQLMAEPLNLKKVIPFVSYAFYLDEKGQMLSDLGVAYTMVRDSHELTDDVLKSVFADTLPFLFCLSLTHCRNVEVVESTMPPTVAKKRKEKDIPVFKFKHLVIKPVAGKRTINQNESMTKQNGMMPIHFVRAHFKSFTEERPLFGKHTGVYFWQIHARGDKQYGEITKDYIVKN